MQNNQEVVYINESWEIDILVCALNSIVKISLFNEYKHSGKISSIKKNNMLPLYI